MKLAPLRRRSDGLAGVSGVARLDRRTARLAARLNPGDIAVIDHADLDRVAAEALVAARPAAVINAKPSISGRYPNLGPQVIVAAGILLLDDVGSEVFGAIKEGAKIRIADDAVHVGESEVATGTLLDTDAVEALMHDARTGLSAQLEAFAANTGEVMNSERALLIDGVGIPKLTTKITGRHTLVVLRGHDHAKDLKALRHYIREYKPVLIGVDGGADALIEAGHKPHVIVGDMDSVSDTALGVGAEVVVHADPDGRAPGLARVQDHGIASQAFPTSVTSEDAAMLLAHDNGAELIVSVGSHATLDEFLDRGRSAMASTFLTRLRLGARVVDAHSVRLMYRNRISGAALLMLILATLIAVVAVLAISDAGRSYLDSLQANWDHFVAWLQDKFS
ncbi:putative cytokinetic ring protein SteA [uncultured Jatrophihabitans sp.]|uniref:putative cytokinetic ring protein SteA n=1 Tax=uncultured Jatrophihabitans sp. TaxID=1610747 RepID=UPI0035CA87E0